MSTEGIVNKESYKGTKLSQQTLIGGSIGPYGACLCDRSEYHGNYIDTINLEELKMWHRPRINALVQAGVDFLAIETIPSLTEAEAILSVISDYPGVVCWIAFSCKDDKHLCHGENFCDAITVIEKFKQVEAVGINCTPSQFVEPLLLSIQKRQRNQL
ncbi:homocysteine S-methyltransferase YbgG-like [Xenia sp. Carnegie-2017]|uniref:homocysteine S-methyltransferase YbgG-like n=1 Tax=Xenia sp. Carnegie-2017 TaxID=2897299 RepID=UPI001F04916C|nr:homocysteine S-methyltransferase YbgG-like [Xenia sp. Carnegie-2017]